MCDNKNSKNLLHLELYLHTEAFIHNFIKFGDTHKSLFLGL